MIVLITLLTIVALITGLKPLFLNISQLSNTSMIMVVASDAIKNTTKLKSDSGLLVSTSLELTQGNQMTSIHPLLIVFEINAPTAPLTMLLMVVAVMTPRIMCRRLDRIFDIIRISIKTTPSMKNHPMGAEAYFPKDADKSVI